MEENASPKTLIATVYPTNASNKAVTWTSSNEACATVDQNGKVSYVSQISRSNDFNVPDNYFVITVTTSDGSYTATCKVHTQW